MSKPFFKFFLFAIFFGILHIFVYVYLENKILQSDTSDKMYIIFSNYAFLSGFLFGFLSFLISCFLLLFLYVFKLNKYKLFYYIVLILSYLPWFIFALSTKYEKRYTDWGIAIIDFIGYPLFYSVIIMFIFVVLIYILSSINVKKCISSCINDSNIILLFLFIFSLTSCFSQIGSIVCFFNTDSDHCYQSIAVQSGDANDCEKIKGENFKDIGSNPPKDKCYMMIAANTFNYNLCNKCEGGMMSYSKDDCILEVALKNDDISGCKKLLGDMKKECLSSLSKNITASKVLEIDNQIDIIKDALKKDPNDTNLINQLNGLKEKQKEMLDNISEKEKKEYELAKDPGRNMIYEDFAVGKIDANTKDMLLKFNDHLKTKNQKMSEEQYNTLKNYLVYINDPKNDIEKMSEREILTVGIGEKIGNIIDSLKIWKTKDTDKEELLDQQMRFYEKMLEKQAQINAGISDIQKKLYDTLNKGVDVTSNIAQDKIIESLIGKSGGFTVSAIGEAISEVKDSAKKSEFRGLINAYNKGIKEEMSKGINFDQAHQIVIKNLEQDPYKYEDGNPFVKYGNLLENKDCDGTNPHCINRNVFWKAMKKSYKYQNKIN